MVGYAIMLIERGYNMFWRHYAIMLIERCRVKGTWKRVLIVFAVLTVDLFLYIIDPSHLLWLAFGFALVVCAVAIWLRNRALLKTLLSDGIVWSKQYVDRRGFWNVGRVEGWSAVVPQEGRSPLEMLQTRQYNDIGMLTQVVTRTDEYSKPKIINFKHGAVVEAE